MIRRFYENQLTRHPSAMRKCAHSPYVCWSTIPSNYFDISTINLAICLDLLKMNSEVSHEKTSTRVTRLFLFLEHGPRSVNRILERKTDGRS